jgi:hypothetical protein
VRLRRGPPRQDSEASGSAKDRACGAAPKQSQTDDRGTKAQNEKTSTDRGPVEGHGAVVELVLQYKARTWQVVT